jgi:hypothetical protein
MVTSFSTSVRREEHPFQVFGVGKIDPRGSEVILVPLHHHKFRAEINALPGRPMR